jgi:Spy/CpxP family protein refolding chaperone
MSSLKYLGAVASGLSFVLMSPIVGFAASPAPVAPKAAAPVAPKAAAPTTPAPKTTTPAPKAPAPAAMPKPMSLAEQLQLTDDQKAQLQKMKDAEAGEIAKALTGKPQAIFQQRYKLTRSISRSLASAKVPADQQKGIRAIRTAYNSKMMTVLTEAQMTKLKAAKAESLER